MDKLSLLVERIELAIGFAPKDKLQPAYEALREFETYIKRFIEYHELCQEQHVWKGSDERVQSGDLHLPRVSEGNRIDSSERGGILQ
jgi:hypothetical protein